MDVTRKYSIAYKGLKTGDYHFDFGVDGALFRAFEYEDIKDCDCTVEVELSRAESLLSLSVSIGGEVVVLCDRCLEECRLPVSFQGQLLVKFSDQIHDYDGEVLWISPAETEVDLSQYIYESIVLSLPFRRVHPDGECDEAMLQQFRTVTPEELAGIEASLDAATPEQQAAWAKLVALKEDLEQEQTPPPHEK